MRFDTKNVMHYVIAFGLVAVGTTLINNVKNSFETNDENKLIRDYLLNESPLYGYNRPKLWIHSKYEINARKWKDFYSRNTTDLNQPYLHLTIKSIINHCGDDFNICLIDDESFNKLLPSWDVNVSSMAEPVKSQYRELGMVRLLQVYGGIVVPNSFLCIKNLKPFYDEAVSSGTPFVCENINRTCDIKQRTSDRPFLPSTYFMGANKNDKCIVELVEYIKQMNSTTHITNEAGFIGELSQKCQQFIRDNKMKLVGGEVVGVKTAKRTPIILDDLMEEAYLDLDNRAVGIYIPGDEILRRPKYQWFAVLPSDKILHSKMIISKYILTSMVDSTNEYYKSTKIHSVVTI
jgi:hypothetical protein